MFNKIQLIEQISHAIAVLWGLKKLIRFFLLGWGAACG
jgi:hypothetical protein